MWTPSLAAEGTPGEKKPAFGRGLEAASLPFPSAIPCLDLSVSKAAPILQMEDREASWPRGAGGAGSPCALVSSFGMQPAGGEAWPEVSAKRSEAIRPRARGLAMLSSPQEASRWPVEPGVEGCNWELIGSEPETDRQTD